MLTVLGEGVLVPLLPFQDTSYGHEGIDPPSDTEGKGETDLRFTVDCAFLAPRSSFRI